MSKIDYIYEVLDDYGLITSAEAKELGVSNAELVQQARRGKLKQVARGVYRVPVWPYQESAPYALAVKTVGPGAYLFGESVVALLGLIPTDPARMLVGTPKRVRKTCEDTLQIIACMPCDNIVFYEGIPSQFVGDALISASQSIGPERAIQAANEALKRGLLTKEELQSIDERLHRRRNDPTACVI